MLRYLPGSYQTLRQQHLSGGVVDVSTYIIGKGCAALSSLASFKSRMGRLFVLVVLGCHNIVVVDERLQRDS
jgi:hypothetical protein